MFIIHIHYIHMSCVSFFLFFFFLLCIPGLTEIHLFLPPKHHHAQLEDSLLYCVKLSADRKRLTVLYLTATVQYFYLHFQSTLILVGAHHRSQKTICRELILSFCHVGPRNQTQVHRPGGEWLYLSHFAVPPCLFI